MRLAEFRPFAVTLGLLTLAGCGMPMTDISAENRAVHWSGAVSACDDSSVLSSIERRFAYAEAGLAGEKLEITRIAHIRQTGFRKNGKDFIPRRDCVADVVLSNQRHSTVHYTVVAGMGAFSLGDRVEFCVAGHDHYHLGDAACTRMSR